MKQAMIGYLRRSKANKKRPEDPAYGIEAQLTLIERAAEANDWEIVWPPEDDRATGAHTRRAGLQWAPAELAASRADGLVVAKLTRLSGRRPTSLRCSAPPKWRSGPSSRSTSASTRGQRSLRCKIRCIRLVPGGLMTPHLTGCAGVPSDYVVLGRP